MNANQRIILATGSAKLPDATRLTQFIPMSEDEMWKTLYDAGLWLGPREPLETMPAFRQIIPYIILKVDGQYINYLRTPKGGEERLHGKISIGLGGHVDLEDIQFTGNNINLEATLESGAAREVLEEVGDVDIISKTWVGLVAANLNPVDYVHVGAVAVWELASAPVGDVEDALDNVHLADGWTLLSEQGERLETWTALFLRAHHG